MKYTHTFVALYRVETIEKLRTENLLRGLVIERMERPRNFWTHLVFTVRSNHERPEYALPDKRLLAWAHFMRTERGTIKDGGFTQSDLEDLIGEKRDD